MITLELRTIQIGIMVDTDSLGFGFGVGAMAGDGRGVSEVASFTSRRGTSLPPLVSERLGPFSWP